MSAFVAPAIHRWRLPRSNPLPIEISAAVHRKFDCKSPLARDFLQLYNVCGSRKENAMPRTRESSSPKARKSPNAQSHPTQEEIALRAYHIFLERNGAPGNALDDWTRAERELLANGNHARRKAAPKSIAA
jgi:hypothetical protein